ncbi:hypothetical protein SIID45300_02300 [Candidatus Magnetaquicoccaceae bacterium FCR-1]|uniref:Uncharacterized protein n=1 Tax=Candidatus Magnetaquiglobus chichijimensis TaxID=3141448 RepID=A0ABQ0CB76_9PROT
MGQYMTIRIPPRRDWSGDMEPEYEEITEWHCPDGIDGLGRRFGALPLSWRAMIAARSGLGGHRFAS